MALIFGLTSPIAGLGNVLGGSHPCQDGSVRSFLKKEHKESASTEVRMSKDHDLVRMTGLHFHVPICRHLSKARNTGLNEGHSLSS